MVYISFAKNNVNIILLALNNILFILKNKLENKELKDYYFSYAKYNSCFFVLFVLE